MRVDLSNQGAVKGSYTKHRIQGIPLLAMSEDAQTDRKESHRVHILTVRLRTGKNSATEKMLNKAYLDHELAGKVIIYSYDSGKKESLRKEWVLSNATISSKTQTADIEEIKFTYQKIVIDTITGGASASDDWQSTP